MTDDLLICPNCGWLYLNHVEADKVPVCGKPRCRSRLLRQATEVEAAALSPLATVGPPKMDILLGDSRRFYAVETGGSYEVYDNHINAGEPKALILDDIPAHEVEGMTEGYLLTVTPNREVEVALVVDLGRYLMAAADGRIQAVDRDNDFLVAFLKNPSRRTEWGMTLVTVPASWCAGDSDLHKAGWYIERIGEDGEEVCMRTPRIRADGTVYMPGPKEVVMRGGSR